MQRAAMWLNLYCCQAVRHNLKLQMDLNSSLKQLASFGCNATLQMFTNPGIMFNVYLSLNQGHVVRVPVMRATKGQFLLRS